MPNTREHADTPPHKWQPISKGQRSGHKKKRAAYLERTGAAAADRRHKGSKKNKDIKKGAECRKKRLDMSEYVRCVWGSKKSLMPRRYQRRLPGCAFLFSLGKRTSKTNIRRFDFCIKFGLQRLHHANKTFKKKGEVDKFLNRRENSIRHTCPSHIKVPNAFPKKFLPDAFKAARAAAAARHFGDGLLQDSDSWGGGVAC